MAKRRGRRDLNTQNTIPNDPLSALLQPSFLSRPLNLIEDRRAFHFDETTQPVMSVNNHPIHTIEVSHAPSPNRSRRNQAIASNKLHGLPARVVFGKDERGGKAVLCERRERRREVLFSLGKGGSKKRRKVRRNRFSKIGC